MSLCILFCYINTMLNYYSQYLVPLLYLIPALLAFAIGMVLRKRISTDTKGINYVRLLYYICLAEGVHNAYYFMATLLRIFDVTIYESMMLPLPWLLAQGIIAGTFLLFGIYFLKRRDLDIGDIRDIKETADKFRVMAFIDPLTNLKNRRTLDEILEKEKVRASRMYRPFILMMFDLDGFKQYNDAHGHQGGDRMLMQVSDSIRANLRLEIDVAFRFGGDEFFVILPETVLSEARVIAERLNDSIKKLSQGKISLSIGLVEISPDCRMKPEEMVKLADIVMYRAKKDGGNQIFYLAA